MASLARKPAEWFKIKSQVRKEFPEEDLRRLGESMRERQLEPVGALADGTLLYGERRVRAAKLAGIEVDALLYAEPLSEGQIRVIQLTENVHRADLTGGERWQAAVELMTLNQWKGKDLAEHLHLDPSSVTRLLSPSRCIPAVQQALCEGKVGISDVYAISKLDESQQAEALALKLSGASRDQLERVGRKKRDTDAVRLTRIKCQLPGGRQAVFSGEEATLSDLIEWIGELLKIARKAKDEGLDVSTFQKVLADRARAGG